MKSYDQNLLLISVSAAIVRIDCSRFEDPTLTVASLLLSALTCFPLSDSLFPLLLPAEIFLSAYSLFLSYVFVAFVLLIPCLSLLSFLFFFRLLSLFLLWDRNRDTSHVFSVFSFGYQTTITIFILFTLVTLTILESVSDLMKEVDAIYISSLSSFSLGRGMG